MTKDARQMILQMADGDGRYLLNLAEQAFAMMGEPGLLSPDDLAKSLSKRAAAYDKDREEHYNLISALHKSVRGSDPDAALYWFARMLEGGEDPLFLARRLIRMASEDIGLADPTALMIAGEAARTFERLGSPEGELVPMTDSAGNTLEYKKDKRGKTVVSKLDEAALVRIAAETGAAYLRYTDPDSAAEAVRSSVSALDLEKSKGKGRAGYKNRYQWPLALALLLLLIELLVMEKGFEFKRPSLRLPRFFRGAAALLLLAGAAQAAGTGAEARKGNSAYGKKDYPKAVEHYSRAQAKAPKDRRLDFNIGNALYRAEEYDKAAEAYDKAAVSPKVAARASYNRGNAMFRKGDMAGAIAAYRQALDLAPGDKNAKFNLQKALEQKKKNSCEQPQDKKDPDKKDQDKKPGGGEGDKKEQEPKDGESEQERQEKQKQQEQQKKKAEAQERSRQILEMMKEKEKAAARDPEAMKQAARQQGKPEPQSRLEDW